MEKVKEFFISFLEAEAAARNASLKRDIAIYNKLLAELNGFLSPELHNSLSMLPQQVPKSDSFYARYENAEPRQPRYLFRVDRFRYEPVGDLFRAITALMGGMMDLCYDTIFWARPAGDSFEVFAMQVRNPEVFQWDEGPGYREFNPQNLGDPVETVRLLEPEDDEESMEAYNS